MISEHLFVKHVVALDLGLLPCPPLSGRQTAAAAASPSLSSFPLLLIESMPFAAWTNERTDGRTGGGPSLPSSFRSRSQSHCRRRLAFVRPSPVILAEKGAPTENHTLIHEVSL